MEKLIKILFGFLLLSLGVSGQIVPGSSGHGAPTFNCAGNDTYKDVDSGLVWQCVNPPTGWIPIPQFMPWGGTSTAPITAADAILKGPRIDVRWFGAVNDGVKDNCTALTNATNYAVTQTNAVLSIPFGTFATSCSVQFLTNWYVEGSLKAIAGGTAASTALVSTGTNTAQAMDHKGIYGPGFIDGGGITPVNIWIMQGHFINISTDIIGIAPSGKGVYAGDDSGVGAGGFSLNVYHSGFGLRNNPAHTGSVCIYISAGNGTQGQFTDNVITENILHDCSTGYQDFSAVNDRYTDNYIGDASPVTTCGELFGNGGTLLNEYCDSPSTFGFRAHGTNTRIIGGVAYMGTGGIDNVATAVQFDTAEPQAMVSGLRIFGQDATHRWAADTNLGTNATQTTWCDIRDEANVVTKQQGTGNCVRGGISSGIGNQIYYGGVWLKAGGMYTANPSTYSCTTVCAFNAGSNWQKATLTQNATSTFTVTTAGNTYANFTFLICQPATGGPFTFTPPANSVGFGTIGTTAGLCSVQEFVWDGTKLRASSTMQINE